MFVFTSHLATMWRGIQFSGQEFLVVIKDCALARHMQCNTDNTLTFSWNVCTSSISNHIEKKYNSFSTLWGGQAFFSFSDTKILGFGYLLGQTRHGCKLQNQAKCCTCTSSSTSSIHFTYKKLPEEARKP